MLEIEEQLKSKTRYVEKFRVTVDDIGKVFKKQRIGPLQE